MKSTLDLIKLAGLKTNLSVDANNYSTLDLIKIVGFVGIHQRHLTIRNAQVKSTLDLMKIVSTYGEFVTLDFS
ncbi:hypothetical protein HX024_18135 [Myroides marinus]|uniref:hypothetical protein n=1 Tax=Myroides marinus TaxID=703342 RepID=UPI0025780453|nr:hypothetical protein [Myroides marinus]MDM1384582.1 hypothetical protein [Myroides marinus]